MSEQMMPSQPRAVTDAERPFWETVARLYREYGTGEESTVPPEVLGRFYSVLSHCWLTVTDDSFTDYQVRVRYDHEDAVSYPLMDVRALIDAKLWVRNEHD